DRRGVDGRAVAARQRSTVSRSRSNRSGCRVRGFARRQCPKDGRWRRELGRLLASDDWGLLARGHRRGRCRVRGRGAERALSERRRGHDPERWCVSASTGPFAAHGGSDPQARIFRQQDGEWRPLGGGLPEPIPAMPYAVVAADRRLFAGLADGQIWESGDRGDTWEPCALDGDALSELHALAPSATYSAV